MSPPTLRPGYRRAAALCCLAVLASLAGCSGAFAPESRGAPPPAVEEIRIENHDTTAREVSVLVVENGSVVRWEAFDLRARSAGEELDAATLGPPALNGTRGEYVVYVRAGDANRTVDLASGRVGNLASDCAESDGGVRLEFTVREDGTIARWFGCAQTGGRAVGTAVRTTTVFDL